MSTKDIERAPWFRGRAALVGSGVAVLIMIVLLLIDTMWPRSLSARFGIVPRNIDGLDGILFAPLLHANFSHLISNAIPLAVLCFLVAMEGWRQLVTVIAFAWLGSGIVVWLVGGGNTIGASGIVFGLFGYLLTRGIYTKNWRHWLLAAVLFLIYGSILWGLTPLAGPGISWQGHAAGFASGVLAALFLSRRRTSQ